MAAAVVVVGTAVASCSSVPSMPSLTSLFGSNSNAANSNASVAFAPQLPTNFECPNVIVRQGAATMTSSANPQEPSALNLRYQVGIANTARECRLVGPTLTIKVGVQGRVILGPAGAPGEVDVPLRIAVVREAVEPQTIATKLAHVAVSIPPGDSNVLFSHVEEDMSFPMPPGSGIDAYVVYVGFDPLAARERERQRPPARKPRPRRDS